MPDDPYKSVTADDVSDAALQAKLLRLLANENRATLDVINRQVLPGLKRALESHEETLNFVHQLDIRVRTIETRKDPHTSELDGRVSDLEAEQESNVVRLSAVEQKQLAPIPVAIAPAPPPSALARGPWPYALMFAAAAVGNFFAGLAGAFIGR